MRKQSRECQFAKLQPLPRRDATGKGRMVAAAGALGIMPLLCVLVCLLPAGEVRAQANSRERAVESIVPWLDNNSSCSSVVSLQNLGNREIEAEVEAHKSSGALAALVGPSGIQVRLSAGEHADYKLQLPEDTSGTWVRVREMIPAPNLSPVLAVSGATECLAANELQTTVRVVALAAHNERRGAHRTRDDPHVRAPGPDLGMLFGWRAVLGSSRRWGRAHAALFPNHRGTGPPVRITAVSGGPRWELALLADYPGRRDCSANVAPRWDHCEGISSGLHDHFWGAGSWPMSLSAPGHARRLSIRPCVCG